MSKAQRTREHILLRAAELFNQKGVAGVSMSDLMQVTGLQKGGIYNHFKSKDELALEAFDFAIARLVERYSKALKQNRKTRDRLRALILVISSFVDDPPVAGGCPILNTAIESDDAHPALRDRAQVAMNRWRVTIRRVVETGIKRGEVASTVDADEIATLLIACLEGGVMMSKLYGDPIHIQRVGQHLNTLVDSLAVYPPKTLST